MSVNTPARAPSTRAEWVDAQLREAILTGELAPGTKLRAEHLAQVLGVSPTPLREAFQRLAGVGLVTIEPQRGARVALIDPIDAIELYDIRLALEPDALRQSVERSDDAHRATVASALAQLEAPTTRIIDALRAHESFHASLLARCPNQRLIRMIGELHVQCERFQVASAISITANTTAADHRGLADAIRRGNADLARDRLARHLTSVRDSIARTEGK